MIEFKEVSKSFQNDFWSEKFKALDSVSFHIEEGKLTGFLGANGAGKTTSLKILMQFIKQDSGEILYGKAFGRNFKEFLANVGYLPERPYFYPHLTGRELVHYMGKLNGVSRADLSYRCKMLSEKFQIDHALDRKIKGYSKGMLQRIGFVSALIHDPAFIILDEPVAGLDPVGRKEIKDALISFNKEGKTIFFSSHIVSDVEEICSSVVVLQSGKLLYQGAIDRLIESNLASNFLIKCEVGNEFFNQEKNIKLAFSNDNYSYLEVNSEDRNQVLKSVLSHGGSIISVEHDKPSLEEVIYKIKSN